MNTDGNEVGCQGQAHEVWCVGSDRLRRFVGIFLLLGFGWVGAISSVLLVWVLGRRITNPPSAGMTTADWMIELVFLGVMAVLLNLPLAMGVRLFFGKTFLRMEPDGLSVRRRMGWRARARYGKEEIRRVMVGENVEPAARRAFWEQYHVVLELSSGEHVTLVGAKEESQVRSVAWEVADYFRIAREEKLLAGWPAGVHWVPAKGDMGGVEPWEEERVVGAGRWQTVTATQEAVEVRGVSGWRQGWVWMAAGLLGLFLSGAYLTGATGGVFSTAMYVIGSVCVLWYSTMLAGVGRVRVDGSGVTVWDWSWGWRRRVHLSAEGLVGVRMFMPRGAQKQTLMPGKERARTFWLLAVPSAGRDMLVISSRIHGPAGYVAGVGRMMELRLLKGRPSAAEQEVAGERAQMKPEVEAEAVRVGEIKEGRVVVWPWRWMGAVMVLLGLFLGVLAVVALKDDIRMNSDGSFVGRREAMEGAEAMAVLVGLLLAAGMMVAFYAAWVEVKDGKLRMRRSLLGVRWTVWEMDARAVLAAWFYRSLLGRHLVERMVVVTEEKKVEAVSGVFALLGLSLWVWPVGVMRKHAQGVNELLGVKMPEAEVVLGKLVEGVVLAQDERGQVFVPREMGAGKKGDYESHEMARVQGRVELRRKRRRVTRWGWWLVVVWTLTGVANAMSVFGPTIEHPGAPGPWVIVGASVLVWVVGLGLLIAVWVTSVEKVEANERGVEVMRVRWFWPTTQKLAWEDVEGLHVNCEHWRLKGREASFSVGARMKDGGYVRVVTGIASAGEAWEIVDALERVRTG